MIGVELREGAGNSSERINFKVLEGFNREGFVFV